MWTRLLYLPETVKFLYSFYFTFDLLNDRNFFDLLYSSVKDIYHSINLYFGNHQIFVIWGSFSLLNPINVPKKMSMIEDPMLLYFQNILASWDDLWFSLFGFGVVCTFSPSLNSCKISDLKKADVFIYHQF